MAFLKSMKIFFIKNCQGFGYVLNFPLWNHIFNGSGFSSLLYLWYRAAVSKLFGTPTYQSNCSNSNCFSLSWYTRPKGRQRKLWKDEGRWEHDKFREDEQAPKSRQELIALYGYDIRSAHNPDDIKPRRVRKPR